MAKIENFQVCTEYSSTTLWVKQCVEIALSLTVSEVLRFFHFSQKIKMAARSGENWNFLKFCIEYFSTTLRVKNSVQIALSLTVSEILRFFRFSQKFKMAAKSGENWKFSCLYRILFYYPVSQKLCRNRSISYGFRGIKILSFFAKN